MPVTHYLAELSQYKVFFKINLWLLPGAISLTALSRLNPLLLRKPSHDEKFTDDCS